ncbi:MAG: DUF6775 family putative metallopeptidase [Halanaeroarchaeum sp.]
MVERISLYRAPTTVVDENAIATWLRPRVGAAVSVRERFLSQFDDEDLAADLARTRVHSPSDRETGSRLPGIVRYEDRLLEDPDRGGGVLYDGHRVTHTLNARIPGEFCDPGHQHVVLTDRAVATWGTDGRWHKRVIVLGAPTIVSVPGLYEAPAKPEAYYREKRAHTLLSGTAPPREVLESEVEGEFLVEDDPRTTEALAGYVLQAVHFAATGEAFCEDERCRLHDAHRQSDLVTAQLGVPEFCPTHAEKYGLGHGQHTDPDW